MRRGRAAMAASPLSLPLFMLLFVAVTALLAQPTLSVLAASSESSSSESLDSSSSAFSASTANTECPWDAPGLISYSSTFGSSATVTITAAQRVLVDVAQIDVTSIIVRGQLIFANSPVHLRANWIRVENGGAFILGTAECRYTSQATVEFRGSSNTDHLGMGLGTKGLGVYPEGRLEIHGVSPMPTWTRLRATAARGSTQLHLEAAVDWLPGQRIVVASTDYDAKQSEEHTIVWVTPDRRTLHLLEPLAYPHWGQGLQRAEVGLLNRNIRFQGLMTDPGSEFGGQVAVMGVMRIQAAEFTRMGQQGILARYPVHAHMIGNTSFTDAYVKDCGIHNNFQRSVVIHGTCGALVQNNVAWRTRGHSYFLEDGGEVDNLFQGNLGIHGDNAGGTLLVSDSRPTVFWITNMQNHFIGNAAVGGEFGFWIALPERPMGLSEPAWRDSPWMWPRQLPPGEFRDNVIHSADDTGYFMDEGPTGDMAGNLESTTHYWPRPGPYDTDWRGDYTPSVIMDGFVMYKNRVRDIWARVTGGIVRNSTFMDALSAVQTIGEWNLIEGCLFVGESDNPGFVDPDTYYNRDPGGRSRPYGWRVQFRVVGFEIYDIS